MIVFFGPNSLAVLKLAPILCLDHLFNWGFCHFGVKEKKDTFFNAHV